MGLSSLGGPCVCVC